MARPTLATHHKFAKLVSRLRDTPSPRSTARGILELLWDAGYSSGDPFVGDAEAVEAIVDWRGIAGELAGHLVTAGFLDVDDKGGHHIHDLADHAPDYVARRMAREQQRVANGTTIAGIRAQAASKRRSVTDVDSKRISFAANVQPPSPSPSPDLDPPTPLTEKLLVDPQPTVDPLTVHGLICLIRAAVEAAHPELGMYRQGRWAFDRATRFVDEVPAHKRTEATRDEIRARIRAFAASNDAWIVSKGWFVEGFVDRYAALAKIVDRSTGPPMGLAAKYTDRPQLKPERKVSNGPP